MNYGIPYQGSKQAIAEEIISYFPKAMHFYDLFGGGGSVTHCLLEKRGNDFSCFHFNELRNGICDLIKDAINGKYNYDKFNPEWISRDRFEKEKHKNAYIRICWSFGNNQRAYMFSKNIEIYKKSMHQAVVFNEFNFLAKEVLQFDKWSNDLDSITRRRFFWGTKLNIIEQIVVSLKYFINLSRKKY